MSLKQLFLKKKLRSGACFYSIIMEANKTLIWWWNSGIIAVITMHLCLIFTLLLYLCVRISLLHVCFRLERVQVEHHRSDREMLFSGLFYFSLRRDCKVKSGCDITAHQSTLCQRQYTHELNVKIVSLSPKNVNHSSQRCGHLCLRGLFPQQVEQFMSQFKMSA